MAMTTMTKALPYNEKILIPEHHIDKIHKRFKSVLDNITPNFMSMFTYEVWCKSNNRIDILDELLEAINEKLLFTSYSLNIYDATIIWIQKPSVTVVKAVPYIDDEWQGYAKFFIGKINDNKK